MVMSMKYSLLRSYLSHEEAAEIRKKLIVIALPAMGENILQMLLGIADTAFLGHYDWRVMSGVGVANQMVFILQVILIAVSTGTMVYISNGLGAKNQRLVNRVSWHSIYLAAAVGIAMTLLAFFSDSFIEWFFPKAEPIVQQAAQDYLAIILLGATGFSFMIVLGSVLRGAGDTKSPMITVAISNAINIFLDYALIFGRFGFPELGARGAATATIISRFVGATILLYLLFRNKRIAMGPKPCRFSSRVTRNIFSVGLPTAFDNLSFSVGIMVFANILLLAGARVYAAHRIGINVESISFMPAWGLGVSITALVGMYNGAGQINKVIGTLRQGWIISMCFSSIIGILIFLFPRAFIMIFTNDAEIIQMASLPVRIIGLFQIILGTDFAFTGALRGLGDTRFPMIASMIAMWLVRIPVGFVLVKYFGMGLMGAWIGMMIDMILRMSLKVFRLLSGNWEKTADKVRKKAGA
ncbi:MAG: hypothetical protein PWQ27_1472 [Kosmotoga sp.]|uniref:Multidrug-efflux transporter n=2 Tax=Kosmotogaceae TaxID=1643948 RepID=C5CG26_KOSOT|nr:MATE efflux family protein [Kosmotoga olearia TBF 19.5.1]MDI3524301.1 hypothetical protein [Kosmotoga sp.]MDK2954089.1 hypothetical protein [Kosmotoga sp.]